MKYFNVKQHQEPKSMFSGNRLIDFDELNTVYEITEEQARKKPDWGSGNISVDDNGKWEWMATHHDTSG